MTGPALVRVACAQLALDVERPSGNLDATLAAIATAAEGGAQIVVLPELAASGYVFADRDDLARAAESRDGPTVTAWAQAAARHGVVVVGGFPEQGEDGAFHNSAVIVDPDGPRAFYRKAHLWDTEQALFTPGDQRPPVVDTVHGRIGVLVCYDLEFPEWVRLAALDGADLLCAPANWPLFPVPPGERPIEVVKVQANAAVNRVAVAVCDRTGSERGVDWLGGSVIVDADGYPQTEAAYAREAILVAEVDLGASRAKQLGPGNDVFGDRRTDLYGPEPAATPTAGAEIQHETDRVRVARWTLPTGASTGRHTHEHDYVVIPLAPGRMTLAGAQGITRSDLQAGVTYVRSAGVTHDVSNGDAAVLDFVEVELLEDPPPRG